jgi:elongator complex protein 3
MAVAQRDHEAGRAIIDALVGLGTEEAPGQLGALLRRHGRAEKDAWTKSDLLLVLEEFYVDDPNYPWLKKVLTKRPIRSLSGITSITVLTKPFPCPGRCVFCPVDVRMPKSYIATEPGAQRAGRLGFDPYAQVTTRLRAYSDTGHPISKIEFIVLGGTWSAYPEDYKVWFVKRMFEALNDFGLRRDDESHAYPTDWDDRIESGVTYNAHINASKYVTDAYVEEATLDELYEEHRRNETAASRCVGLSLETRPDVLDRDECLSLRRLGATKIQIGIQSLDDNVLRLNKRGHKVKKTEEAIRLLRQFGFKVHAHWMPNLYGSTAEADIVDYQRVFDNPSIRPDELKVYPTVLIQDTELEQIAGRGDWQPYSEESLNSVLAFVLTNTPEYCRLTRIIRDIPAHEILAGNKKGNFRQIVENGIAGGEMRDIRAREIKNDIVAASELQLDRVEYETATSLEIFLQYIRPADRKIAAFLRLSLPKAEIEAPIDELAGEAIIREVHVYGQSIVVGDSDSGAQHQGLGRTLVAEACDIARTSGFADVAIISAVGTRPYYEKLGFTSGELYQHRHLQP